MAINIYPVLIIMIKEIAKQHKIDFTSLEDYSIDSVAFTIDNAILTDIKRHLLTNCSKQLLVEFV